MVPFSSESAREGDLVELEAVAAELRASTHASSTLVRYRARFRAFEVWCVGRALRALPAAPRTVELYLASMVVASRSLPTIEGAYLAIVWAHRSAGHGGFQGDVSLSSFLKGLRRNLWRPPAKKVPLMDEDLLRMLEGVGTDLIGVRDRALLSLGWFGAFRRSELVALEVADVTFTEEGLIVLLRRSKTDQGGHGEEKGIPFARNPAVCAVRALHAWLEVSSIESGPVFRRVDRHGYVGRIALTGGSVALIVKRLAEGAGLDPEVLAGHSLRSGFITTAAAKGKGLDAIMRQSLHKSEHGARDYIQHASLFVDNAADGLV